MAADLKGYRAKLHRAKKHLEQLRFDLSRAVEDYGFAFEEDPQTGECVVNAWVPDDVFVELSVDVGEVVHQTRSALEHLVWQLVLANNQVPRVGMTGFPVFDSQAKYENGGLGEKMIKGINNRAAEIIRGLQPYGHPDDPLNLLTGLWNRDKHRLLNYTGIRYIGFGVNYLAEKRLLHQFYPEFEAITCENGAELLRFRHPVDYRPPEVQMVVLAAWSPILRDAGPATGQGGPEFLGQLIDVVERIGNKLIATI